MHHYFSMCWLPLADNFLHHLQYMMIIFSCMFDYPNSFINRTSSIPITSDNRDALLYFQSLCLKVFVENVSLLYRQLGIRCRVNLVVTRTPDPTNVLSHLMWTEYKHYFCFH